MTIEIQVLGADDATVLGHVAPGVFDRDVDPELAAEFLADRRHHLAVALDGGVVVGMASAVHYVHPDKPPELWIDEVGVAPTYRRQGLGKRVLGALLELGRELECAEAWVLTDREHVPAMGLYSSLGGREAPRDAVMFRFPLADRGR